MANEQEILKIKKDLDERIRISNEFRQKGYYTQEEKEEAIKKVLELRFSDPNVMAIAVADNADGYTPPEYATDEMVLNEINKQIEYLKAKQANELWRNK